jgi:hypothetical protein
MAIGKHVQKGKLFICSTFFPLQIDVFLVATPCSLVGRYFISKEHTASIFRAEECRVRKGVRKWSPIWVNKNGRDRNNSFEGHNILLQP